MLGFLLSLLIPIKIAVAAVLLYLFLKLATAAETPNSKLLTPNIRVDEVQELDAPGAPGVHHGDDTLEKLSTRKFK